MSRSLEHELDGLALITLQAAAFFTFDRNGNIVATNEPEAERAPRLFFGLTEEGFIAHHRDDVPKQIVRDLERLLDKPSYRPDPHQLPAMIGALCDVLEKHEPVTEIREGPAWRFPATIPEPEGVVAVGPENSGILRDHFPSTAARLDDRAPCFAIVDEGVAVSICYSSRVGSLVAEAGVDTVEAFRGRGYAVNVVAAWAKAVRASGHIPLYSTAGDNLAARAVAHKLGLVLYGIDLSIH